MHFMCMYVHAYNVYACIYIYTHTHYVIQWLIQFIQLSCSLAFVWVNTNMEPRIRPFSYFRCFVLKTFQSLDFEK